tara:strand:- start:165 stop:515 length:351 start_codon:yes stop_codon:yes gene_type:complete
MITMYGIKNCDTCRKALKWLQAEGIEHRFHDFRADGLEADDVARWVAAVGWEVLLNRRGTTWRKLPDTDKDGVDEMKASVLMQANPTLIKRPVFDIDDTVVVGFKDAEQQRIRDKS